jgi:signal transduction histidine kinase
MRRTGVSGRERAQTDPWELGCSQMSTADAYPFPTLPTPLRFAVAVAAVGAVFVADRFFGTVIDDGSHFLLLSTAVMASAWFAGTGPALAATVTGALVGAWQQPHAVGNVRATGTHLAMFVVQGLLLTALVSELRRARRVAEQQAHVAQVARRETEAAGRMKDEFLATISHELRTPLNSVLGWLHLLRTGKLDSMTSSRGLESIERNVRLQAQLTGDLLDVSKAVTGQLLLDSRAVSLVEAAHQAVAAAMPAAQAKGVHVTTELPELSSVAVLGDATRLRQVVWHLLANAIKFTPRGGAVALTVEESGDSVVVTVADSGPGIDPEFLPRIFQRFTQEDPSPTRTAGGLGVGLSLVRDLVELHGGEIRAQNRNDDNGAVFTATFPRHAGAAEVRSMPLPPLPFLASPPLDGLRVLVLDQDADGRELLRTVLQQRGAAVRTAGTVADALESLEAWRPDVLVSDSVAPKHDSYALVGKVRSLDAERGGRIPAAALTAWSRVDLRVRRMLEPVQTDLPKPIEPAVLTAEIARLTGRERRRAVR